MTPAGNRFTRRGRGRGTEEIHFGRMLVISVVIHGLVVLLTLVTLHVPLYQKPVETYHVELVTLPVATPQRGRPTPAPAAAVRPVPSAQPAKKQLPAPVPLKTPVKATAKAPEKKAPEPDRAYDNAQDVIEGMQRKQEREALKRKLAAMREDDSRQPVSAPAVAPGTDKDKGKDPGSSYEAYIRQELKKAWTLSRYQVSNRMLQAEVTLTFDSRGTLTDYRFLRRSGEARFDESVQRAILDLRQLPSAPGQTFSLKVIFNLKELLER